MKKPPIASLPSTRKSNKANDNNLRDALRFKQTLGNGVADFLTVTEGPGKNKAPNKHRGKLKGLWPTFINLNKKGNAIFMMPNLSDGKGTKDENITKVNAFFLDYDGDKWKHISLDKLLSKFTLKPHVVVKTSEGHYHVYWLARNCKLNKFKDVQKALADKYGGDPKVSNLARFMRVPGTFNHKDPDRPFLVTLEHCDKSIPSYSASELVDGLDLKLVQQPKAVESSVASAANQHPTSRSDAGITTDDAIQYLKLIEPNDREIWIKVAMALKSLFGDAGLGLFLPWSAQSNKYDENEATRQWQSISAIGGVTGDTLRYLARQGGGASNVSWSHGPENMLDFASMLVQDLSERVKYAPNEDRWHVFISGIWLSQKVKAEGVVLQYLHNFVRKNPRHPLSTKLASITGVTEVMRLASTDSRCHIKSDVFDARVDTVAVEIPDGMGGQKYAAMDLTTGLVRQATPGDFLSKTMGVPFIPSATCPRFLTFLDQISGDDSELREALQIAFGYAMFGHVQDQVMFVLIGEGSNGKGVFLNTMKHVFGGYATTVSYSLLKRHNTNPNAPTPALAPMAGARFVQSSEFGEGEKLEEALVKNITGSDPISYRQNYGAQTTFKPQCKIFLSSNYFPRISFEHEAMWRRLFAIRFTKKFTGDKCNSNLEEQLKAEASGILNWLIQGAVTYHRLGKLLWPASTLKYLNSLKQGADTVGTWLKNSCRQVEGGSVAASEAYASYKLFTRNNNQPPIGVKEFKGVMVKKGYQAKRRNSGNVFIGLVINE